MQTIHCVRETQTPRHNIKMKKRRFAFVQLIIRGITFIHS